MPTDRKSHGCATTVPCNAPPAGEGRPSGAGISRRSLLKAGLASAAAGLSSAPALSQTRGRTYVLVHGAWFGGWVWKTCASSLRAAGHTVYAPTMTGLGDRRHLLRPGINLDTHTDDIVNLIEMEDLNDIVLVGWSYGGMVVGNVLGRVPQRIASMVYLDAFVPDRGRSLVSYANRSGTPDGLIQQAMEGKDLALFPLDRMGITDKAVIDYCMPRLGLHPIATFLQASKAPAERPKIPHTYVLAGANPGETFKIVHKRFVDEKAGDALVLNTSHATMLTDPAGTVEILKNVK